MITSPQLRFTAGMIVVIGLQIAHAQRGASSTGSKGSVGTPNTNSTGLPGLQTVPTIERQSLHIWGKVTFEQGRPPPEPVSIERVCSGSSRREGYTDLKGQFGFQLGQNLEIQDAT